MGAGTDNAVGTSADQTAAGWSDFAETYDEWLAPQTRRFAEDVVRTLDLGPGVRVLDVAAGTGAFTLAAARAGAEVLAIDFAPGMVALLRRKLADAGLPAQVAEMDGQALTAREGTFDVAASLFGLIFFPDVEAGAAELRRVLRVGGRAAVTAWGTQGFAVQRVALEALARIGVVEPEHDALPAAFRLSDPARLEMLLVDAGFGDVVVQELEHSWPVPDPEALFRSIPSWSAPMRPVFARLEPEQVRDAAVEFAALLQEQAGRDGLSLHALLAIGSR